LKKNLPHKNENHGNIFPNQDRKKIFWPRPELSFGGFLTKKKLAKLLNQYFDPNNTHEEVVAGTVWSAFDHTWQTVVCVFGVCSSI
jgi:hypothetical protein